MNKTIKRNVLLTAALTIMLCVSLIAGATFALFTSESKVNIAVTSGKVDVVATASEPSIDWDSRLSGEGDTSATVDDNTVSINKILPGVTVNFSINIENNSDVTVKYRTVVKVVEDGGLWEALKVTIDTKTFTATEKIYKTKWTTVAPNTPISSVSVAVALPYDEDNSTYQGKTCKFAYTVEALQGNAIPADEWDGETITAPSQDKEGIYHITNAAEFVQYIKNTNTGYDYVLDKDINLGGYEITVDGSRVFGSNFDGQNHTISNFTLKGGMYTSLFGYMTLDDNDRTIKNLIVRNATVIGGAQTSVILSAANKKGDATLTATVDNCKVYDSTIIGEKKVAPVVGYTEGGTIINCYAENCNVYCNDSREYQAGAVVGYINVSGGHSDNTSNNTSRNVEVVFNASYVADGVVLHNGVYEISNANGMFWFAGLDVEGDNGQYNKDIKLVADIDLKNRAWTPICNSATQYSGIFDGNGHTIYNLKVTAPADAGENEGFGLFAWSNGTIKNLTIDGAEITANHYTGTIVGYMQAGTIDNCHVKNAKVTNTHMDNAKCGDKAGALVGYANCNEEYNTNCKITNCSASNCEVTAARDAAQLIGYSYDANIHSSLSATNVTVTAEVGSCSHERAGTVSANALVGNGTANGLTIE